MQTTRINLSPVSLSLQFPEFKDCWHLATYIPNSGDALSQSIIAYKNNNEIINSKWNNLALKHIAQLKIKPDFIVRALGSREMLSVGEKGLDRLCHLLAHHYNIFYNPYLLMKKQFTRPLHSLCRKERITELHNRYVFNLLPPQPAPPKILILDDIITTGATMQAIYQSIKKAIPEAEQYFFTLAKTKDKYG